METKIKTVNDSIDRLKERITELTADRKELQAQKRKLTAAMTAKPAAKKAAAKKVPAKKPAVKKAATRKTTAKKAVLKEDSLLGGLMEGLKDAGLNPEDLLKSLLGGK